MKVINHIKDISGLVISAIEGGKVNDDEIIFSFTDGNKIKLYHDQDCCEAVFIYEIDADIQDIVDGRVIEFREDVNTDTAKDSESQTWTFYNISTTKGSVNIRWLGESNGYYSERVDITNLNITNHYNADISTQ